MLEAWQTLQPWPCMFSTAGWSICSSEGRLLHVYLQGSVCKLRDWTCPFENQSRHAVAQFCKEKESPCCVLCARERATLLGPKSSCHWPCIIPVSPCSEAHRRLEAVKVGMDGESVRFCDKYWRSSSCALVPVGPVCAGDAAQQLLMQVQGLVWAACFGGDSQHQWSLRKGLSVNQLVPWDCEKMRYLLYSLAPCHISTMWGIQHL